MPSVHGEDAVIRILDKESISEQFHELRLDILGFPEDELRRFRKYIAEPYGMVLVTGPTGSGKTTTLYARAVGDQVDRGQDHHDRGPGRVPAPRHHADPGQREEGADLRARPALDPAPRPRQDHGRRDPRRRDGADRDPVGADRPPRVHHRPRQQRARRARPLPQHGRRALPVRVGAQLRAGAAAGAATSASHCKRPATRRRARCSRSRRSTRRSSTADLFFEGAGCIECGGTGFKGRTAICELLDLSDSIREMILERRPDVRDQEGRARGGHALPARVGGRAGARRASRRCARSTR